MFIVQKHINIRNIRKGKKMKQKPQMEINENTSMLVLAGPIFMELLPLSLEEIFISETEVAGYDIKKLIF